jgi:hypothetical protein
MGFKLNYPMNAPDIGVSATGTNTLALPYNQQTSLVDASDLRDDINTTTGVGDSVVSISQFIRSDDSLVTYTGSDIADNFTLVPGEGYRVVMRSTTPGLLVNLIIVGSHDPGKLIDLFAPAAGVSATGTNDFAYPYHGVAANASELRDEIVTLAGVADAVVSISKLIRSDDSLVTYTGSDIADNFSLTPGNSYRIVMRSTTPGGGVAYSPAHY